MAEKHDKLASLIVNNLGGAKNVKSITCCVTRLRFSLMDESKADTKAIESTDGVIKVVKTNNQYQVTIDPQVNGVYNAVVAILDAADIKEISSEDGSDHEKKPLDALIDLVSGIFQPILGVLSAAGMIKGFLALFSFLGLLTSDSGLYQLLYGVSDGFFYFLPIILGYTTAKKFGLDEFIGMVLGAALVYPALVEANPSALNATTSAIGTLFAGTPFEMSYSMTVLGLPVIMPVSGYKSSVVPSILIVWFASKVQKPLHKYIPASINFFMVPLLTLAIGVVAGYIIIGPIASVLTSIILACFNGLFNLPVVGGLVVGTVLSALWQVLVIFGLHWALIPLYIANLSSQGFDQILSSPSCCALAQAATVLAIFIKTKDPKAKQITLTGFFTALFGTIEPSIYGITLPRKKPFVFSCIGGAVGGAFIGLMQTKSFTSGYDGLMGLPCYIDPSGEAGMSNMWFALIGWVIAATISFTLTMIVWKEPAYELAD
jgi:PTS system beta-glucosides-specific IIC component